MAQFAIIFRKQVDDIDFVGFQIFNQKNAKKYMKLVQLLQQSGIGFDSYFQGNSLHMNYSVQDFQQIKVGAGDVKTLIKLFGIDVQTDSNKCGLFPDAMNDAYENNIDQNQQREQSDLNYQEQDY